MIELKRIATNKARGIVIGIAMISTIIGSAILWGIGGFFLSLGIFCWIEAASDEALERITLIERTNHD